MKLLNYFKDFLDSTVNLNQTRLDLLDQRVQAIVSCLEDDSVIGTLIEDHIPQGSWAHRTIIRPLPGDEFDADFLLLLTEVDDWSVNPRVYPQRAPGGVQALLHLSRHGPSKEPMRSRRLRR